MVGPVDLSEVHDVVDRAVWLMGRNETSVIGIITGSIGRLVELVGKAKVEVVRVVSLAGGALARVRGSLRFVDDVGFKSCTGLADHGERGLLLLLLWVSLDLGLGLSSLRGLPGCPRALDRAAVRRTG